MKLRTTLQNRLTTIVAALWTSAVLVAGCGPGSSGDDGNGGTTTGAAGTMGSAGAKGAAGTTGAAGAAGTAGTMGGAGTTGVAGSPGAAGTTAGRGGASAGGGGGGATGGSPGSAGSTGSGGGMCGGATGAPFAPIADYTARDGGFGPAAVTRNTGDTALGADKVAIFRPAAAKYGQGGLTHPIIVWGNGHTNTVDIWQSFLSRVATYGFVVVAPEQTEVTAAQMNAAIDYVLRLAGDPTSGDCGKIDTTKIGSTGYSLGGAGAISVGSNARVTSTFIFASNGNVKNLKAPWGVIGGDADTTFNWTSISAAVTGSTQPAFGAALAGIDHNRVAGQAKAQEGYIAWMRWRFMGDPAGHDMFVGASCKICTDAAFSGVVKTPGLDSL
jgi:hypothetical protein